MKKIFFILLLYSGLLTGSIAQNISIRPRLVALQVKELERSRNWYKEYLGFEVKSEMEFAEYKLRIAFLHQGEFELELVDNENAFFIKEYVPDVSDQKPVIGFAKLTFEVNNIQRLFNDLKKTDVKFVFDLTVSNLDPSEKWFMVEDPDANVIQLIGK